MRELTGIFTTDGRSRSGSSLSIPALEDMLWQSFTRGTPSTVSHDFHRGFGWTRVSSLYVSHELAYVLGKMFIPETEKEIEKVSLANEAFLNSTMVERIKVFYDAFYAELKKRRLVMQDGKFLSNGIVMYGADAIALKAFPFLDKSLFDKDGLLPLSVIKKHFDYKGCGVFAAKKSAFSLLLHPYLRRSLSRFNNYNTGFIDELLKVDTDATPVRLRIDESFIGFSPSYIDNVEYSYWFGPSYSDEIMSIPEGLTSYVPNDVESFYNQVCKTDFLWVNKDGKRQFEMEEVVDVEMPTEKGNYGCRYLHSLYDPSTGVFDHFDGAIRAYDVDTIQKRRNHNLNQMGHGARYTKIFRIDGTLPINKWKSLITHYLRDNQDVYRYFKIDVPFKDVSEQQDDDALDKYAHRWLSAGDGVRLLVSYHDKITEGHTRFFSNLDTITFSSDKTDAADSLVVDLAKSFIRDGIDVQKPKCSLISCTLDFKNLPVISHCGIHPQIEVNLTLSGITSFVSKLKQIGDTRCLSFGIAWNIDEDRSIVVSFMGAVPDLSDWLCSFSSLPVFRNEFRVWLDSQVKYLHRHGRDDISPANATYIQSDGTFFQKRRNIQEDVAFDNIKFEGGRFLIDMEVPSENKDLQALINSGALGYIPLVVIDKMTCTKTGLGYISSPLIASFGETQCQIDTIKNMFFVWCRNDNNNLV